MYSRPRNPSYLGSNSQAGSSKGTPRSTGTIGWTSGSVVRLRGGTDLRQAGGLPLGPRHDEGGRVLLFSLRQLCQRIGEGTHRPLGSGSAGWVGPVMEGRPASER
jgi:hypothetical protein